jgi:hypothetical protein
LLTKVHTSGCSDGTVSGSRGKEWSWWNLVTLKIVGKGDVVGLKGQGGGGGELFFSFDSHVSGHDDVCNVFCLE